jgi:hypothetical protein
MAVAIAIAAIAIAIATSRSSTYWLIFLVHDCDRSVRTKGTHYSLRDDKVKTMQAQKLHKTQESKAQKKTLERIICSIRQFNSREVA